MHQRTPLRAWACAALAAFAFLAGTPSPAPAQQDRPAEPPKTVPGWAGTAPLQPGQAPPEGGLVPVAPGGLATTNYAPQPTDLAATGLLRADVYNLQDEKVGRVEDLIINGSREVAAVVVGVGGFLGVGERYTALPPSAVALTRTADGTPRAVVDATRDSIRNAPEFKYEGSLNR